MRQEHGLLMGSLSRFYSSDGNIERVVEITEGRSEVSLRLIDWFVTNYAKKRNIIHHRRVRGAAPAEGGAAPREGPDNVAFFSVYLSYREELRTFSKQQFDPFRRNGHIIFRYGDGKQLETTVGQLNFFRWAIEYCVLDYIQSHRAEIERSMSSRPPSDAGPAPPGPGPLSGGPAAPPRPGRGGPSRKTVISFD